MIKNKMGYKKIFVGISIILFINIFLSNISKATYEEFNDAPVMKVETDKSNYTDVKIIFKDQNGINSSNLKICEVDSKGNKTEILNDTNIITKKDSESSEDKECYIMSNEFLNKKTHRFYIELFDNTGNYIKSYFRIISNGKGYGVDYAPRIIDWGMDNKKAYFYSRDLAGTKELRLYDMNNNEKKITTKNNLAKGSAKVKFNISSFKEINGMYRIKIYAIDKKNGQAAIREISFSLKEGENNYSNQNNNTEKSVINISINKKPTKQKYEQNTEDLDLSGGEIRVEYSDSSYKILSMNNKLVKNSGFSNGIVGKCKITLEYKNKITSFSVTIVENDNKKSDTNTQTRENLLNVLTRYSKQVESDYKSGKPWRYIYNSKINGFKGCGEWTRSDRTFEEARNYNRIAVCLSPATWALKEIGVLKLNQYYGYTYGTVLKIKNGGKSAIEKYATIIDLSNSSKTPASLAGTKNELLPGDIIGWSFNHMSVYAGNHKFFDSGRIGRNGCSSTRGTFSTWGPVSFGWTNRIKYIIRLNQ